MIPQIMERSLQLPLNAPPKLLEDIQNYSAFVELQQKLSASQPWYLRLS